MGLYFKISIALFYILAFAIYAIIQKLNKNKKFKIFGVKRYLRYIKLVINKKVIFTILIFSIISNTNVILQNQKYENLYSKQSQVKAEAIVVGNKKEKEHYNRYKIKIITINSNKKFKNTYLYLRCKNDIKYGDKIKVTGEYIEPEKQRNYGGFNSKEYLKTLKIYGSIKADKVETIKNDTQNKFITLANLINIKIKQKIDKLMDKETANILKGILLGDSSNIEEEIKERFKISNITHILAVSGMHISYLILGCKMIFIKKAGKQKTYILIILLLVIYTFITGFSPSVVRASIMGILVIFSKLVHRKNDVVTAISISLFLILTYNPFLILSISLQFSYLGTIGILLFHKTILKILRNLKIKNEKIRYKINKKIIVIVDKIKEILSVTISANLAILPISILHFNMFGTYFLLSNLFVTIIIGPIIILGIIMCIIPCSKIISIVLTILIKLLNLASNFSNLPFSKIYIPTPKIVVIIAFYLILICLIYIYNLYNEANLTISQRRIRNLIALVKYKLKKYKRKYIKVIIICLFILVIIR